MTDRPVPSLAITLTDSGRELPTRPEQISPAVVERLGLPMADLHTLHDALTRQILPG